MIHTTNFKQHLTTLTLSQLKRELQKHTLAPAQLYYMSERSLTQYNQTLDLIEEEIEKRSHK